VIEKGLRNLLREKRKKDIRLNSTECLKRKEIIEK